MKKVLIIDPSPVIRDFLYKQLNRFGFKIEVVNNGLDGRIKIRSMQPNLVIMNYKIPRVSTIDILKEKLSDPELSEIPVIIIADKQISREDFLELARYKINRLFPKPLKIDSLIKSISELLGINLMIDQTPCIIDVHFNEEILFIEIARGLNTEKLDILKYKIYEILKIYKVHTPRILIMMTDIQISEEDLPKLEKFLINIKKITNTPTKGIQILTVNDKIRTMLDKLPDFNKINVSKNMASALDKIYGIKVSSFIDEGLNIVKGDFLRAGKPIIEAEENFRLQFEDEEAAELQDNINQNVNIAIIDADISIHEIIQKALSAYGYNIKAYSSGDSFLREVEKKHPHILFLDLKLPDMSGFDIIKTLKAKNIKIPVIMMSPITKREVIIQALGFGIKSYMVKPLTEENVRNKLAEVLTESFR
jgi:DNA-binding response OmpR family regulator